MGMKRKASTFEEDHLFSPTPSISSLPSLSSSHSSPESVRGPTTILAGGASTTSSFSSSPIQLWNFRSNTPHYGSRTRKRHRDGRPDEETVQQKTLKKLFDAQKQQHIMEKVEAFRNSNVFRQVVKPNPHVHDGEEVMVLDGDLDVDLSAENKGQARIESFFGQKSPQTVGGVDGFQTFLNVKKPSVVRQAKVSSPAVPTCEDCERPLRPQRNTDSMDVDLSDSENASFAMGESDEWSCTRCARRTCDTCAVKGDDRVCLECALPGAGEKPPAGISQRRLINGYGWV